MKTRDSKNIVSEAASRTDFQIDTEFAAEAPLETPEIPFARGPGRDEADQPQKEDLVMADETVEFIFQETPSGDVIVKINGEVFTMVPDGEDVYRRENVLAEKLATAVARELAGQSKQVVVSLDPSGAREPWAETRGSQPPRKRGRPAEIPEERKKLALTVDGARARAEILYATKYPTLQQKKNVSSIMRNFVKKGIRDEKNDR